MTYPEDTSASEHENGIGMDRIDLSSLVGQEIVLFTEKFKGKPLNSRVILAANGVMSIDPGNDSTLIDSLTGSQNVVVQFVYRGQRISVDANLKKDDDGNCTLILSETLVPLSRRRFRRFAINRPVRCAAIAPEEFDFRRLSKLRWLETDSINFSSGGVLIRLPKNVSNDTYLLLNIHLSEFDFPNLVVGQVRYSYPVDSFKFNIGIEFIVDDVKDRHFPPTTIKRLPGVLFEYNADRRRELNRELSVKMYKNMQKEQ